MDSVSRRAKRASRDSRLSVRELRTVYTHLEATAPILCDPAGVTEIIETLFDVSSDARENLFGIYLDSRGRVIGSERIARGGLNACAITPRDILSSALVAGAATLIVAHNHPSGDATPSGDDVQFTQRLAAAARLIGLELSDHVIIAGPPTSLCHVSLAQRGLL